jgi:serine/threonine protein kinase/Tfp pilus assembly protein PilF
MKCPKCQADNPDNTLFCGECGTKFPSTEEVSVSHTRTLQTPVKDLIKGTTFAGRYQIIDELGRGGMGVVYRAQDTKLKRTVALKFLPTELTHISEIKERFMREAQAAAALDHPNICTVHEFDEAEEKTFISMAYIEGKSLRKKIESGPLGLDEALGIFTQVAEGLQEAHKKGVVHRDIKSSNIMLDERGRAKIMDFGLARVAGGTLLTKEGMTMGTIAYMSPEQAQGKKIDHRSDIWSLGVVFYELLTGQLPFRGEHEQTVVYSILNEPPKPVTDVQPDIPEVLEQIIGKALEKNPNNRYQNINELLDDLESISKGIEPEGIKARLRKAKLVKKKKAFIYASIAGFIIIIIVMGLSLFTGSTETMDSIAVLPVENLSGNPDQEYFSDGVTDALINELAKISALRVISRQSVIRYKGSEKSLPEIARELNVDAVVEASALTVGNRVQIRAQLIQAPTEQNLWAQSYEREISDILVLQSEIAQAIAREVKVKLTPLEQTRLTNARPVNPEAYQAYLKGRFHWYKITEQDLNTALEYFQLALDNDPNYALAYVGFADALATRAHMGFISPHEVFPKAKEAALKALELDDALAEAHDFLARLKFAWDWDWQGAETGFRRAIELNPNYPDVRVVYSQFLAMTGHWEQAIGEAQRGMELDPLNSWFQLEYGDRLFGFGRYDDAIEQYQKVLRIEPNMAYAHDRLWSAFFKKQMYEDALAEAAMYFTLSGDSEVVKALERGYEEEGYKGAMKLAAETLVERSKLMFVGPIDIARLQAHAGQKSQALDWLEKAYEQHESRLVYVKADPVFENLRDDPRFKDLFHRMKLPELK